MDALRASAPQRAVQDPTRPAHQPLRERFKTRHAPRINGFAGPGRYRQGEPGSPILALGQVLNLYRAPKFGLSRDRVHLIFIEERADRYTALQSEITSKFGPLDQLPVTVRIINGSAANEILPSLAGRWGGPILAVFDSWGNVSVPLEVTRRIASNRSSEVLVTFGPNYFSRQSTLRPEDGAVVCAARVELARRAIGSVAGIGP